MLVRKSLEQFIHDGNGLVCAKEHPFEAVGGEFVAVGDHPASDFITEGPRGAQAHDNPFGLMKTGVRFGEMAVDLFEQSLFGGTPKVGVMTEGAEELPSHFDDIIMGERSSLLQAFDGLGDAGGVVKHPEGIHQGVEPQTTADGTDFVGETGAKKEDAVTIGNGLG